MSPQHSSKQDSATRNYGRGTGVPHPIDVHIGQRVRLRRLLLGMNLGRLAKALGLTFQQVQKYESGTNRLSPSRLVMIADALGVSVDYFFAELGPCETTPSAEEQRWRERRYQPETIDLIRYYYAIADPQPRQQFLLMVKIIASSGPETERPTRSDRRPQSLDRRPVDSRSAGASGALASTDHRARAGRLPGNAGRCGGPSGNQV